MIRSFFVPAIFFLAEVSFGILLCPPEVAQVCNCYTEYVGSVEIEERNHVNCSSRGLYHVPIFNFRQGTKLYQLSLANNTLITISPMIFPRKLDIQILDISKNPIGNTLIGDFFADSTTNLKTLIAQEIGLNLRRSISFIRGLHSLEELDLSRNLEYAIQRLPELFYDSELHSLKKLSLSLCRISDMSENAFQGLNNLRKLDLSLNFLSRVPRAVRSLSLLKKLSLRENDITIIHRGDFGDLHCLEELDLSINLLGQLEAFSDGAFVGMENSLRSLALQDCHMAVIPTMALSQLKKLKHLDISHNKISFMNNRSFIGDYHLETLDISVNPWLIDDEMFYGVQSTLRTLIMQRVGLSKMPVIPLLALGQLRHLDLSNNNLRRIDNDSLSGIPARKLYFSGNKISYISPYAFWHYTLPIVLDVSKNRLQSVEFVFDAPTCTFYYLNISDNGLPCNCAVENLINSRRVKYLTGNCELTDRKVYQFNNVTSELEQRCGKLPATFCLWWVPRSSSANETKHIMVHVIVVLHCIFIILLP